MAITRKLNEYDVLKAFAIILVVIGHITILFTPTTHPHEDTRLAQAVTFGIYLFHMPLFMSISGAVYQLNKNKSVYQNFDSFIFNKFKRVIVPYFCIGFLALLPVLVYTNSDLSWSDPSTWMKILLAKDCRHLWYLLALFFIFIFQFVADRLKINLWILFALTSVWTLTQSWLLPNLNLLCIHMAFRKWPCFILGMIMVRYLDKISLRNAFLIGLTGCVCCIVPIVASSNYFVDSTFSLILPYFICSALIVVARQIALSDTWQKIISTIAGYSFGIYLFHVPVIYLLRHWVGSYLDMWVLMALMFVLSIAVSVAMTALLRKLDLGFVIGENKRR